MTDADLIALILSWRDDIDSVPFAHEDEWTTAPVFDGEYVADDRLKIGSVEVGPGEDDMWFLDDGQRVQWFRKVAAS